MIAKTLREVMGITVYLDGETDEWVIAPDPMLGIKQTDLLMAILHELHRIRKQGGRKK
jgi:hypothetical protein